MALLLVALGAGPAAATTTTTFATPTTTSTTLRPFTANDVCSPTQDPCQVDRTIVVPNQSVLNFGSRGLVLTSRGVLDVGSGRVTITAGTFEMQPGAQVRGNEGFSYVKIGTTGDIKVRAQGNNKAKIDLSSDDIAGALEMAATGTGSVTIDGIIFSKGTDTFADGGAIDLRSAAGDVTITSADGDLSVGSGAQGFGGEIFLSAGRDIVAFHLLDGSGGDGGGGSIDADAGRNATFNKLSVDAGGFGDGGFLTLTADGDIVLGAAVTGNGSGGGDFGGDGADIEIAAGGALTVAGDVVANAGDGGTGGSIDIGTIAGKVALNGALKAQGVGTDGCGGDITVASDDGLVDLRGLIDVSSGACGSGTVFLTTRGSLVVADEVNADGDGGWVDARGSSITFADSAQVHADGAGQIAAGNVVAAATCELTVAPAARLSTAGTGGSNNLKSGKTLVVAGRLTSGTNGTGGENAIEYRDAATPPVLTGIFSPAATVALNPGLASCVPPSTSTTTSTSSTTTTTIEGFCRSEADCTKALGCTTPRCTANACEYPAIVGREGVLCRIDQLQTELTSAPAGAITKKGVGKTLAKAITKARTLVQQATGSKAKSRFKKARAQLTTFVKTVRKGRGKTIDASFATRVDGIASVAVSELGGLTTGR